MLHNISRQLLNHASKFQIYPGATIYFITDSWLNIWNCQYLLVNTLRRSVNVVLGTMQTCRPVTTFIMLLSFYSLGVAILPGPALAAGALTYGAAARAVNKRQQTPRLYP